MACLNEIELRKFVAPEFVFGSGAVNLAGRYAKNLGARKVLVVTDDGVIKAGWTGEVLKSLDAEGLPYSIFSDITPNPKEAEVMAGAEVYLREGCNFIITVGGGSPMDCAKGIAIVSSNKNHILEFEGVDRVPAPGPPLICIPTTAGSSADVSQFAIISDRKRKVKIAMISKKIIPDVALIDPCTTTTMDGYLTACTGIDALCHSVEAYVSNASSQVTDLHAIEAIRLISKNLLPAIKEPYNMEYRKNMMLGSMYAGLAFSNASLGIVHAMAHSLGGFLDFPHGEANAILLSHAVSYNFSAEPERYINIGKAMGLNFEGLSIEEKKKLLVLAFKNLQKESGIVNSLKSRNIDKSVILELAKKAIVDPCIVTNPRAPNNHDIEVIYGELF